MLEGRGGDAGAAGGVERREGEGEGKKRTVQTQGGKKNEKKANFAIRNRARLFWPMPRPLRAIFAASLLAAACFALFSARLKRDQKRSFPVPDL